MTEDTRKVVWMVSMVDNNDEVLFSNKEEAEKYHRAVYKPDNRYAGVDEMIIYDMADGALKAKEAIKKP